MAVTIPDRLPNGAKVLAFKGFIIDNEPSKVRVLCKVEDEGAYQPYVTWALDKENNAYWGHYFCTVDSALEDFKIR